MVNSLQEVHMLLVLSLRPLSYYVPLLEVKPTFHLSIVAGLPVHKPNINTSC